MKSIKSEAVKFSIILASFIAPVVVFAQQAHVPAPCFPDKQICNPVPYDTLNDFIKVLLEGVLKLGIPLVALAIIYSGFLFVAARGNSESLKKAKDSLLYSVIGAAVLLGAWAIAQLISNTVLQFK